MALDKVLKIYDENGNEVDYDILAKDVKLLPDGKDLPTKLAEMQEDIDDAASSGYAPPEGGIPATDLAQAVQDTLNDVANKVDKVTGKGLSTEDFTAALKAKLEALDPYTKAQVDALISAASSGAVSVTTNEDGTFTIHVGETDYTINLNHTHENMAKIVKCTEATLPDELADDTIYVQVDDASNPTEIESLYLFGLEFTGGGAAPGTPAITRPSGTTINLGENHGSGVSKTIEIKANTHITGDLTVGLDANSGLSFDTSNLPSGVTYNSGAGTLTIAQATAMQGVNITIVYSGSGGAEIDGGLVITGGGATPKSVVIVVEEGLPEGWLGNTAWNAPSGEKFTAPELCNGYVTTEFFEVAYNSSGRFDIAVKAGYVTPTDLARGMFVSKTALTDATTYGAYLQKYDPRRLNPTSDPNRSNQYFSATMKASELATCYIYDYVAGRYLWAGSAVDTSVTPDIQPS